jgi:hypothetical protein
MATVVGAFFVWRWWTTEPAWGEMEALASTFPVPAGFDHLSTGRIGDRPAVCQVKPSCENARVSMLYRQRDATSDPCELFTASVREWEGHGFVSKGLRSGGSEAPCVVDGMIDGHTAQALVTFGDGGRATQLSVIVWS